MKKRMIAFLIIAGIGAAMLYRYGSLAAVDQSACEGRDDKFECRAQAAKIEEEKADCMVSCKGKKTFDEFAAVTEKKCKADCGYLRYEGKTTKDVEACKTECEFPSYDNQQKCQDVCEKKYEQEVKEFESSWK